jgi:flagella basal body P-ring formation protein FlgA
VSDLPLDGEEQLGAEEILELIVAGGIELERVGYSIPPTVRVHRLARALDQEELRVAIVNYLSEHKPDLELSSLTLPAGQRTFAGATLTSVGTPEWLGQNRLRIPIKISTVALDAEQQLLVEAKVAKFANVPVARASISRGATIDTEKLVMARVNLADLPLDVVTESRDLVGRTADIPVAAGAYFRSSAVKATPLVRSGSALTVRYQHGSLIATVAAVALQDGAMGELIKVRNNASNRVLEGRVVDSALVEIVK